MRCLGCEAEVKVPKDLAKRVSGVYCKGCEVIASRNECEHCSGLPVFCDDCYEMAKDRTLEQFTPDELWALSLFLWGFQEGPPALGRLRELIDQAIPDTHTKSTAMNLFRKYLDSRSIKR